MLKILLVLTGLSVFVYFILAIGGWSRARKQGKDRPRPSYFWGLMFAAIFYYGFPLWWWRYGFAQAFKLVLTCFAMVAALQALLSFFNIIHVQNLGESFAVGLLISVPMRAIAGLWVARKDAVWRNAAIQSRMGTKVASAE